MDETDPPTAAHIDCPFCAKPVTLIDPSQTVLNCPECGQQFYAPTIPEEESTADADLAQSDADAEVARREAELSELRISQVANLRRGAIRSRSWFIVGAVACVVAAIQFVYLAFEKYRMGQRRGPIRDLLGAAALLILVPYFTGRVSKLGREIAESRLKDPTTPPDFSTLSDGSQRWTNLEQLAGSNPESSAGIDQSDELPR